MRRQPRFARQPPDTDCHFGAIEGGVWREGRCGGPNYKFIFKYELNRASGPMVCRYICKPKCTRGNNEDWTIGIHSCAIAQLTIPIGTPSPKTTVLPNGHGILAARRHTCPISICVNLRRYVSAPLRCTIAKLAIPIGTPGPKTAVSPDGHRVITRGRHTCPSYICANLYRSTSLCSCAVAQLTEPIGTPSPKAAIASYSCRVAETRRHAGPVCVCANAHRPVVVGRCAVSEESLKLQSPGPEATVACDCHRVTTSRRHFADTARRQQIDSHHPRHRAPHRKPTPNKSHVST